MADARKRPIALASPRFLSFLAAQFLGALNDNAFKLGVLTTILASVHDEGMRVIYSGLVTQVFALPWLLFSPLAGYLADRFAKDRVYLFTKIPEIFFMALGIVGFALNSGPLLLTVFFLMSTHSTFFSPPKYGMLPEIFEDEALAQANGILGMSTNIAVLLGTIIGAVLGAFADRIGNIGFIYTGIAIAGTAFAAYVPPTPPGFESVPLRWNPITQTIADWKIVRSVRGLWPTVAGLMFFTFLSSLLVTIVPPYWTDVLELPPDLSGLILAPLVVGVAIGSVGAGWLSQGRIEVGLVPLGAFLMALFSFDVAVFVRAGGDQIAGVPIRAAIDFAMLGLGGGLFSIPLTALLQHQSPEDKTGQVIAFSNVATNAMILLGGLVPLALAGLAGASGEQRGLVLLLTIALHVVSLVGTLYLVWKLPDYLARFAVQWIVALLYRMRIEGTHHIPRGGALLVANHVSWVDALLITAASGRMVRFLMYRPFYEARGFHWLFKRLHAIPVAGGDDGGRSADALALAREQIEAGHVVCIFAEGAITRTGILLEFRRGLERIAGGLQAPIVPVYLHGLWGSIFSFKGGKVFLKWPRRFRRRVRVSFGRPMPSSSSAFEVRGAVQQLSAAALAQDRGSLRTLEIELLRRARRAWRRPFVVDPAAGTLSYGEVLAAAFALRGRLLGSLDEDERCIGVLLEPGLACVTVNLAILFAGRVPVNLPRESPRAVLRAIRAGGVRRVLGAERLASGLILDSAGRAGAPVALIDVERDAAQIARERRWPLVRGLAARWLPLRLVLAVLGMRERRDLDSPAVVLFGRGTRSSPRGVVLSHWNVLSNLLSLRAVFDIGPEDCILCPAPVWHGLGFLGGICLPILAGARASHPPDPFSAERVARAAQDSEATLLLATPAALALYAKSIEPGAFASLTRVLTGGSPLLPEVRAQFADRFGAEPLEGYGCAECSLVISLNVLDFRDETRTVQRGTRMGTLGHPLPGVAVQICELQSAAPLAEEQLGRIRVRGPNVMLGYLREEGIERVSSESDADGWFDTGDLGMLDRAGFLRVVGRAERMLGTVAQPAESASLG